jgi:LssY C-terminus
MLLRDLMRNLVRRAARSCLAAPVASLLVIAALTAQGAGLRNISAKGFQTSSPLEKPEAATLPAGTRIYIRLETPVSTKSSHLHGPVTARVVREVLAPDGLVIPLDATVQGEIEKLIPSSSPADRARVLLRFDRLEIPGGAPLQFAGRVANVENARETVLADGTIQGLLASELPLALIQKAVAKLGKSGASPDAGLEQQTQSFLGKADTSIDYPAGTDLELVLEKPLALSRVFRPAISDRLAPESLAAIQRLLDKAPHRAEGKDGKPGDPLNLVVIGSEHEIQAAFERAGWVEPSRASGQSIWAATRAILGEVGYGKAPVSDLFLFGRREDLAFAKMLNTVAKRHHLRLWRAGAVTPDGREIWLGAATHDNGYDIRPQVISHAIDPNLDDERAKVAADLAATKLARAEELVARANPLSQGLTATGASWKTDGRLLAIELNPSAAPPTSSR